MIQKRILVIASRVPYPLDKGDKLRIYHQVKELSLHYEVCLVVLSDKKVNENAQTELEKIAKKVVIIPLRRWLIPFHLLRAFISDKPFQVGYFYQKWAQKNVRKVIDEFRPDFIYCQLIRVAEYVKHIHHIPKSLDYMDAFSKGIERRIDSAGWQRFIFRLEHKRLIKYENLIFDYFEHHLIISDQDRNYIMHPLRANIDVVPNGVDYQYFKKKVVRKEYDIVFVGNMSYPPNVDAAVFLVDDILPLLKLKHNDVRVLIAGANPSQEVLALQYTKNVTVSGWVDDIRTAYASAHVFVAPLRMGTGLQNKLLEAMSMELPCVTSPLAAKAMIGNGEGNLFTASTPTNYADTISSLLLKRETIEGVGKLARNYVIEKYSWKSNTAPLLKAIDRLTKEG
jgi:polysaccharide biosynthesis protein PslH